MARTKWAVPSRKRRKKLLKQAKGNRSARRTQVRKAKETVMRAKAYRTRDRKARKREFRRLWVIRLNAAVRLHGFSYSRFIAACKQANIGLDRKQLSELAVNDEAAFKQVVSQVTA